MTRFSHLKGDNDFPHLSTASPYTQYESTFDYTRWNPGTVVKLCSVPFDCIDDFPDWADVGTRDRWFAGLAGYEFEVQDSLRMVQDGIKLPIPFDASGMYNYLWVRIPRVTLDSRPLDNEPASGVRSWGFFVQEMEWRSPSVTMFRLMVDWWSTFINSATIRGVMLTRGHHAIRQAATVGTYLSNPIANTDWLMDTEPDAVNRRNVRYKDSFTLNDTPTYAVFLTKAFWSGGAWNGASDPRVNTNDDMFALSNGSPTVCQFAVAANHVATFIGNVPNTFPQTVLGVYLVSEKLLGFAASFTFGGVTCRWVADSNRLNRQIRLSMNDFGYPSRYQNLTKLYTSQYAHLTVTTDRGQVIDVGIDELCTTSRLTVRSQIQATGMVVTGFLDGMGDGTYRNYQFYNLATAHEGEHAGAWLDTVLRWDVPCYAVFQGAGQHYDATHKHAYDTALANATRTYGAATNANQTAHDNAVRAATAGRDNTKASAATATANTGRNATLTTTTAANSANNVTANNAVTVAASSANNSANIAASTTCMNAATDKVALDVASDADASYAALVAEQAVVSITMSNNDARATTATTNNNISTATGLASAAIGIVGSAASGNVGGVLGGVSGAMTTIGSGITNQNSIATDLETANASCLVTASNNSALYSAGVTNSSAKGAHANNYTTTATTAANNAKTTITSNNNDAATSVANNNASLMNANAAATANTMNANAAASQATADTNADRSYNAAVANANATLSASNNSAAQARTNAQASTTAQRADAYASTPLQFGQYAHGETAATVPMVADMRIRRPLDGDIAIIGDRMLRYGYTCARYVSSPKLTEMPHFTYWQCSDVWVTPSDACPEVAVNVIRDALKRGVTVWGNPSEVGTISIYDNE